LRNLGDLVVGDVGRHDAEHEDPAKYFPHRSSGYITELQLLVGVP
jgi:hypothetical protein